MTARAAVAAILIGCLLGTWASLLIQRSSGEYAAGTHDARPGPTVHYTRPWRTPPIVDPREWWTYCLTPPRELATGVSHRATLFACGTDLTDLDHLDLP